MAHDIKVGSRQVPEYYSEMIEGTIGHMREDVIYTIRPTWTYKGNNIKDYNKGKEQYSENVVIEVRAFCEDITDRALKEVEDKFKWLGRRVRWTYPNKLTGRLIIPKRESMWA